MLAAYRLWQYVAGIQRRRPLAQPLARPKCRDVLRLLDEQLTLLPPLRSVVQWPSGLPLFPGFARLLSAF